MARKRTSPALRKAKRLLKALKSIDPNLDLGDGLSVAALEAQIKVLQEKIDAQEAAADRLAQHRVEMQETAAELDFQIKSMLLESPAIVTIETSKFVQINSQVLDAVNLLDEIQSSLYDREIEILFSQN